MLTITWQEEIASLKQNLNKEINKILRNSDINVRNHICINNLKSKLERLDEIEKILSIDKYQIVFIGTIGQGKTTAICHLFNLIGDFNVSKTIANKSRNVIETKELLSTGSGKTTICEVIIKAAEKTYIEIEPYPVDEMENIIFEFCESIANKDNPQPDQNITISKEIERAIRNVTEMKLRYKTINDDERRKTEIIDPAKEQFHELGLDELKKVALNNAKLESRTTTKIEFYNHNNEQEWIKNSFAAINNVEFKEFAIPRKIYLYVSYDVLSGSNLSQFDSVVDTKGLDENPIRKDLQKYIESQNTICLFVTPFSAAPEVNISKLISYHLTSKSKDFHHRFVTLVLPHKNEPEKMHGCNEDRDIGIQIRKEEIQATFKRLNLDFFLENILFYDSLRYYRDDIVKINEMYGKEIILDGRPEEKVRQLFIYFLVKKSGLFPNLINIKVESDHHDIELYKNVNNEYFKPYCPPVMIVEVKREEENLRNHEKQIEKYLKKSCSEIGILYNYHQIIAYRNKDAVFTSNYLNSLIEIPPLVLQSSNNIEKDTLDFEKAVYGNFDSFIYLVNKYGKYALNTIIFRLKSEQLPISGCFFKFQDNKVYYDIYGKYTKKQQSFNYQDFEKLVSITY